MICLTKKTPEIHKISLIQLSKSINGITNILYEKVDCSTIDTIGSFLRHDKCG